MADLKTIYRAARYNEPLRERLNPLQSVFFDVCQGPANAPLAWGAMLAAVGMLLFVAIVQLSVPSKIKVVSEPAGAQVFVDGVAKGQAPLVLKDLGRGRHNIELRQDAFQSRVLTVDIGAFSPSFYSGKLVPVPAKPTVVAESERPESLGSIFETKATEKFGDRKARDAKKKARAVRLASR